MRSTSASHCLSSIYAQNEDYKTSSCSQSYSSELVRSGGTSRGHSKRWRRPSEQPFMQPTAPSARQRSLERKFVIARIIHHRLMTSIRAHVYKKQGTAVLW